MKKVGDKHFIDFFNRVFQVLQKCICTVIALFGMICGVTSIFLDSFFVLVKISLRFNNIHGMLLSSDLGIKLRQRAIEDVFLELVELFCDKVISELPFFERTFVKAVSDRRYMRGATVKAPV